MLLAFVIFFFRLRLCSWNRSFRRQHRHQPWCVISVIARDSWKCSWKVIRRFHQRSEVMRYYLAYKRVRTSQFQSFRISLSSRRSRDVCWSEIRSRRCRRWAHEQLSMYTNKWNISYIAYGDSPSPGSRYGIQNIDPLSVHRFYRMQMIFTKILVLFLRWGSYREI